MLIFVGVDDVVVNFYDVIDVDVVVG